MRDITQKFIDHRPKTSKFNITDEIDSDHHVHKFHYLRSLSSVVLRLPYKGYARPFSRLPASPTTPCYLVKVVKT